MTLPTCEPRTTSSSEPREALASKPTINSWPSRCEGVMASMVEATQALAASRVADGDAVLGVSLGVAVALGVAVVLAPVGEEDAEAEGLGLAEAPAVPAPAGSPAHPASTRASTTGVAVMAAGRRVVRGRDVADSTRRGYVSRL